MKKYNIEGGIDFFAELYKSLDDEENNHKNDEDNKLCLITNKPLTDKFVEMSCGHKFNYLPLYYDLINHKTKFNNMEGSATRLKHNEIRCPYCRNKSTGLLPYYEELNLPKVSGVNYIDVNYNYETDSMPLNNYYKKCEYSSPNIYFNPNSQNIIEVYKQNLNIEDCKWIKCNHMGTQLNIEFISDASGDNKYYCWSHKKMVIKNYKKEKADKIKEEKKLLKLKEKEDAQKAKTEAKQKESEEKQKMKDDLKKSVKLAKMNKNVKTTVTNHETLTNETDDNLVIGISNVEITLCQEILKSGKNKGMPCGDKIFENNLCKRHLKKIN